MVYCMYAIGHVCPLRAFSQSQMIFVMNRCIKITSTRLFCPQSCTVRIALFASIINGNTCFWFWLADVWSAQFFLSKFEVYFCFIIVTAWYSLFKLIELILKTLCYSLSDLVELQYGSRYSLIFWALGLRFMQKKKTKTAGLKPSKIVDVDSAYVYLKHPVFRTSIFIKSY